jgi:hypothetical protein
VTIAPIYVSRDSLVPHPDNPRVCLRDDVVSAIAAALSETQVFPPEHALIVRKVADKRQVLSGHHRLAGADKAGIEKIPVWEKELDDAAAYMLLATANNQGELSPLEIGIHALKASPKSEGGRGKKGGLTEYADRIGKTQQYVNLLRQAAEVIQDIPTTQVVGLQEKAKHLSAIHKLPTEIWKDSVQWLSENDSTAQEVAGRVDAALEAGGGPQNILKQFRKKPAAHVTNNSGNNEWYTPLMYIEAARRVLGVIDCDPASARKANLNVQAGKFYTKSDDGRSKPWGKRVWMNPPYAQPLCEEFCVALKTKKESGEVSEAIALINNATETSWFSSLTSVASAVVFPNSRIKFLTPEGDPGNSPLQGQAFVYVGDNPAKFLAEFGKFGWCAEVKNVGV